MSNANPFLLRGKQMQMIQSLKRNGISDEVVLNAFLNVERHAFIDHLLIGGIHAMADRIYSESVIPMGGGSYFASPFHTAKLLELCQVKRGNTVLEVNAGYGFQTALLGEIGAEVYATEPNRSARRKLNFLFTLMGYLNIKLIDEIQFADLDYNTIIINDKVSEDISSFQNKLKLGGILAISEVNGKTSIITTYKKLSDGHFEKNSITTV
jgi:protein-L-isoaspartate(D-aspartate) O-methyltransferase